MRQSTHNISLKKEQKNAIVNPPTYVFRPYDEHYFCEELKQQELYFAYHNTY